MKVEIKEEPVTSLEEYASIPIAFEVGSVLDVSATSNGLEYKLTERRLDWPYIKDYDAIDGEHPSTWARRFDLSNWVLFAAWAEGRRVGGAVVAFSTPGLTMLDSREDLAVLWDIRVLPEARGQGVGGALFRAAEARARTKGCRQLKVETQNINVLACRFYERQGCVLIAVNDKVYPEFTDEVQLLWYKDIL
jgi:GNAT superfamily N-acetyltransferase